MLPVHSIETFATQDGPGIRLVIFTQGCHFRCLYCENPDTIPCSGGQQKSVEELVDLALRQKPYFGEKGGVTISGGEPLLHAEVLLQLFKELKKHEIHTAIDTNGFVLNDEVKELLEYTDLLFPDIKHLDEKKHQELTHQSNHPTLKFIAYLEEIQKPYWLRHVLVLQWTDAPEHLEALAAYIRPLLSCEKIELLPYHNLGEQKRKALGRKYQLTGLPTPSREQVAQAAEILEGSGKEVVIKGL